MIYLGDDAFNSEVMWARLRAYRALGLPMGCGTNNAEGSQHLREVRLAKGWVGQAGAGGVGGVGWVGWSAWVAMGEGWGAVAAAVQLEGWDRVGWENVVEGWGGAGCDRRVGVLRNRGGRALCSVPSHPCYSSHPTPPHPTLSCPILAHLRLDWSAGTLILSSTSAKRWPRRASSCGCFEFATHTGVLSGLETGPISLKCGRSSSAEALAKAGTECVTSPTCL